MKAEDFIDELRAHASVQLAEKYQSAFKPILGQTDPHEDFLGARMGDVFALAKRSTDMPLAEVEKLLESHIHEARVGAVSIMDFRARNKKTSDAHRKALFDLYMRRHDRINHWDLVDRGAPHVVGRYLEDKPRDILYELARSRSMWERRTSVTATSYFIRKGDLHDAFNICEILVHDDQDLVQKAVGGWLREAGKKDRARLLAFLDEHAASMPRVMLRYAIEHLDKATRDRYLTRTRASGRPL